jgi:glyoxylase-like metal-dependent hydrolase (beta-lactamase superfamily II)
MIAVIFASLIQLAAVAHAAPPAHFQRFKIGTYDAVALKDGDLQVPVDGKSFVIDQPNDAVGVILKAGGAPADHFEFSIQPLLVHAGDRVLLFDTGAGAYFGDIAGELPASMMAAGEKPASVTDIFISHAHGDHVGGLVTSTGALTFPKAVIHMSAPEWQWLSSLTDDNAKIYGIQNVTVLVNAIRPKVAPFEPGADVLPGIVKAVDLKGHTHRAIPGISSAPAPVACSSSVTRCIAMSCRFAKPNGLWLSIATNKSQPQRGSRWSKAPPRAVSVSMRSTFPSRVSARL